MCLQRHCFRRNPIHGMKKKWLQTSDITKVHERYRSIRRITKRIRRCTPRDERCVQTFFFSYPKWLSLFIMLTYLRTLQCFYRREGGGGRGAQLFVSIKYIFFTASCHFLIFVSCLPTQGFMHFSSSSTTLPSPLLHYFFMFVVKSDQPASV